MLQIRQFSEYKKTLSLLGQTKVSDFVNSRKYFGTMRKSIFQLYKDKYFGEGGGSFMPIVHLMICVGIYGYSWEYSHLSNLMTTVLDTHIFKNI